MKDNRALYAFLIIVALTLSILFLYHMTCTPTLTATPPETSIDDYGDVALGGKEKQDTLHCTLVLKWNVNKEKQTQYPAIVQDAEFVYSDDNWMPDRIKIVIEQNEIPIDSCVYESK